MLQVIRVFGANVADKPHLIVDVTIVHEFHGAACDDVGRRAQRFVSKYRLGKKLKRFFPGYGVATGTVTKYHLDHDAYQIEYVDGHIDILPFNDVLKLIPKAWTNPQAYLADVTVI